MKDTYDVAIIGYGPVGQAFAALLGQMGHRVAAFERYPALYGNSRAGHFDGETMRLFQLLGIAPELEVLTRTISYFELVSASGELLHRGRFGEPGNGWKASYLMHQPQLEEVLDRTARSRPGVEVYMGWEATDVESLHPGVSVTVRAREGGEVRKVRAKYVIGSDGARSFVRERLGIARDDLGFEPYEFLVLDFEHHNPDRALPFMGEVRQVLDPARPTTAGRWNGNRWSRWEFMRLPGETREQMEDEANCWKLLAPWGIGRDDGRIIRRSVYRFESRIAERWRQGDIFLAGDAAHTMPPFMAQGMCSGLRDVTNLCWKLDAVLRGRAGAALLDTYDRERKPHVAAITEMAMEVGRAVTVTDPEAARLRDAALKRGEGMRPHAMPHVVEGFIQQDDRGGKGLLAGRLAPQARAHRGGRTAFLDDLTGSGWRIVSRHPLLAATRERFASLLRERDVTLVHVTRGCLDDSYLDMDAEYASWFEQNGVLAFVQRPDFQIFGAARDMAGLDDVLASLERQWHSLR